MNFNLRMSLWTMQDGTCLFSFSFLQAVVAIVEEGVDGPPRQVAIVAMAGQQQRTDSFNH